MGLPDFFVYAIRFQLVSLTASPGLEAPTGPFRMFRAAESGALHLPSGVSENHG